MKMTQFTKVLFQALCVLMVVAVATAKPGKNRKNLRGSRLPRIEGGDPVTNETRTFVVSLRVMPKELHRCGGFLIAPKYVVSTATCLYPAQGKALTAYINPLRLDEMGTYSEVTELRLHPNFTITPNENDVAIAILKDAAVNRAIPPLIGWSTLIPMRSEVHAYGWGYEGNKPTGNYTLHYRKLKIRSAGLCSLMLHEYFGCEVLCASADQLFSTSEGDIGTPLVLQQGKNQITVGMLTKHTDEPIMAMPYLALREYVFWMRDVVENVTTTTTEPTTTTASTTTTTTTTTTEEPTTEGEYDEQDEGDEGDEDDGSVEYEEGPGRSMSKKYSYRQVNNKYMSRHGRHRTSG